MPVSGRCALVACVLASVGVVAACAQERDAARLRQAIIDGEPAARRTGVVYLAHPESDEVCSGTVVAPTLVLTAQHCTFDSSAGGGPLTQSLFRVGFGPDLDRLVYRYSAGLSWVGGSDDTDLEAAHDSGEDVAILTLAEPVPPGTHIHPIQWDFEPATGDSYELVGFGLESDDVNSWGTRRSTIDEATGFDPETGRLETTGKGACLGDSGGPLLFGPNASVVGVINETGASSDSSSCDLGLTRGASVANAKVRDFLARALDDLPRCDLRAEVCGNGQDEDCDGEPDDGCAGAGPADELAHGGCAGSEDPRPAVAGSGNESSEESGAAGFGWRDGVNAAGTDGGSSSKRHRAGGSCTTAGPPAGRDSGFAVALGLTACGLMFTRRVRQRLPENPRCPDCG